MSHKLTSTNTGAVVADKAAQAQPNNSVLLDGVASSGNEDMPGKFTETDIGVIDVDKVAPAPPRYSMFLDELSLDSSGSIVVMVARVWDVSATTGRYLSKDFVVSDSKGNMIHCTAKATVAHNFTKLKEGGIYLIKNFTVTPNKDEYRVFRHDMFMIEFDGGTITRKANSSTVGFLRYAFQLVDFNDIELTHNKYFIDVAGYVTNVGRTNVLKSGSKNLDFYLENQRGQSLRVTLWGGHGDTLIDKKTANSGTCAIVLTSVSAKLYSNKLYLSSSSSTLIYDDADIPALQELRSATSLDRPGKEIMIADPSQSREGTIENLLLWARNHKHEPIIFTYNVTIKGVRLKSGWNYPSCGGEKCRKRLDVKDGKFFCGTCSKTVDYPVLRYRLEVVVADDTAHTVVVLFNEQAIELVGCSADSLTSGVDEGDEDDSGLPTAIRNIIGSNHIMEIKSHSYYEYPTYESFNCWRLNPKDSVCGGTSSSNQLSVPGKSTSSFKRLVKHPSVSTPSKPNEDGSKKRTDLEDSDTDETASSVVKSDNPDALARKRKMRYVEDSE